MWACDLAVAFSKQLLLTNFADVLEALNVGSSLRDGETLNSFRVFEEDYSYAKNQKNLVLPILYGLFELFLTD